MTYVLRKHEAYLWKLVPKKVFLAAGNSHRVTKALVLLCWMLLEFGQNNCCLRTKF